MENGAVGDVQTSPPRDDVTSKETVTVVESEQAVDVQPVTFNKQSSSLSSAGEPLDASGASSSQETSADG
jgi:hypothetical protein